MLAFVVAGGPMVTGQSTMVSEYHGGAAILYEAYPWEAEWDGDVAAAKRPEFTVHIPEPPVGDSGVSACH